MTNISNVIKICLVTVLLCISHTTIAQELIVKNMARDSLTSPLPRYDDNDEICALVKIKTPFIENIVFEGIIVGEPTYDDGTYSIYISHAKRLSYHHEALLPGVIDFSLWNIKIKGGEVYNVELILKDDNSIALNTSGDYAILDVKSNLENAQVFLDGEFIGVAPVQKTDLFPGEYELTVTKEHYPSFRKVIELSEGKTEVVDALFEATVRFNYNAYNIEHVFIDGKDMGGSAKDNIIYDRFDKIGRGAYSSNTFSLAKGNHRIQINTLGYESFEDIIEVTDGTMIFDVSLTPQIDSCLFDISGMDFVLKKVQGGRFLCYPGMPTFYANGTYVSLTDYYMSETEITEGLWDVVMDTGVDNENPNKPKTNISLDECKLFISRLNLMTGKQFRLPTSAEWYWASIGGIYNTKGDFLSSAWVISNSDSKVHEVKQKKPNVLGLFDLYGNVWEICGEYYSDTYYKQSADMINPCSSVEDERIILRGGGFLSEVSSSDIENKSYTHMSDCKTVPSNWKSFDCGFRVVLVEK